jgi:hypothetical protein
MGLSKTTPTNSNERQGRTPEKQEGGSKERSDSTCSNKSVEHGHHIHMIPVGYVYESGRFGILIEGFKHCPVQPDGIPRYRSQQNRDNQPQPGGR